MATTVGVNDIDTTVVGSTVKIADKESTVATSTLAQNFETATEQHTTAYAINELEPETDQAPTNARSTAEAHTALIESGIGYFKSFQLSACRHYILFSY